MRDQHSLKLFDFAPENIDLRQEYKGSLMYEVSNCGEYTDYLGRPAKPVCKQRKSQFLSKLSDNTNGYSIYNTEQLL